MGTRYDFTCKACGYSSDVSGGHDVGFVAVVHTMTCDDCRELVDVLTGRSGEVGPTGDPAYDEQLGRCPECGGSNVTEWTSPGPCPRCGESMDESGSTVITNWARLADEKYWLLKPTLAIRCFASNGWRDSGLVELASIIGLSASTSTVAFSALRSAASRLASHNALL